MENERMVREREDCENEKWDICRVCAIEPINRTRSCFAQTVRRKVNSLGGSPPPISLDPGPWTPAKP